MKEYPDCLLVNKPAGLVVHADGRTDESTLADMLVQQYPELRGVGEPMTIKIADREIEIERPGIVHRLDRDTSGVMVVARTQEAFLELKELFQGRAVKKEYLAIVHGAPKADSGTVDAPIGRSPKDFRRWSAQPGARGHLREAVTDWEIVEKFSNSKGESFALMRFVPQTGRTHQIRVHAKYMHHPIISDALYAGKRKPALGLTRQALHAVRITFPWAGEQVICEAPLANGLLQALEQTSIRPETLEKLKVSGIV